MTRPDPNRETAASSDETGSTATAPAVDLLWLVGLPTGSEGASAPRPAWPHGRALSTLATPDGIADGAQSLRAGLDTTTDRWLLLWDARLGEPPTRALGWTDRLHRPVDGFHAGLALGQGGRPTWHHAVHPTWMLTADPDPTIEATSWRLHLGASLLRWRAWLRLGGPRATYGGLEAASLEMGLRWLRAGALLRHDPTLLETLEAASPLRLPVPLDAHDEARFLRHTESPRWAALGTAFAVLDRRAGPREALGAWFATRHERRVPTPDPLHTLDRPTPPEDAPTVTVLVPTIDRYPYLRVLLDQLRRQTVPPLEIVVIDQTPSHRRDRSLPHDFPDLPLVWLERDAAGQCSSRNAGLLAARGEAILFLDDDDEIDDDLVARHLATLHRFDAEISCGVAVEPGGGPPAAAFRRLRPADVLPTNNAMIRRSALERGGLFDLAYEHGPRADLDLGVRLWSGGAISMLDPAISVLHHHAPRGGLRTHRARVATYARSRQALTTRHLTAITEIYLALRHHGRRRTAQALRLRTLGTFAARGGTGRRLAKAMVAWMQLPHTLFVHARRRRRAAAMLREYPQIPPLPPRSSSPMASSADAPTD